MKKSKTFVMICNIICVVAMVAMLVSMCLPYWDYVAVEIVDRRELNPETGRYDWFEDEVKRDENASIMELTWLTFDHESLADEFIDREREEFLAAGGRRRDFSEGDVLNDLVSMPFLVTLLCAFGIVFSLWKRKSTWTSLFPAIAGFLAVQALLTNADYKAGNSYIITLIVSFVMLAAGAVLLVKMLIDVVKWFAKKKKYV